MSIGTHQRYYLANITGRTAHFLYDEKTAPKDASTFPERLFSSTVAFDRCVYTYFSPFDMRGLCEYERFDNSAFPLLFASKVIGGKNDGCLFFWPSYVTAKLGHEVVTGLERSNAAARIANVDYEELQKFLIDAAIKGAQLEQDLNGWGYNSIDECSHSYSNSQNPLDKIRLYAISLAAGDLTPREDDFILF